jgi:hypothetical protein
MRYVSDFDHLTEVIDWLYQRRKGLSYAYGVLLLCVLTVSLLSYDAIVSKLHWQQSPDVLPTLFVLIFTPVAQALFLWGGGRIVHERRSWLRMALPSIVTALILSFTVARTWGNLEYWDMELPSEYSMEYVILAVILAAVLPAAVIKSRRSDHYRTLVFLNTLMLTVAWISCSLTLALTSTMGQAWGWSVIMVAEGFYPAYLLTFVLGTSLVLLWHRNQAHTQHPGEKAIGAEQLVNAATLKASPYIASAANVSSLLLVVLYFGISQGISYSSQLNEIGEIRRAFLREAFVAYMRPSLKIADLEAILNAKSYADSNDSRKAVSDTIRSISVSPPLGIANEKFFGFASSYSGPISLCPRTFVTEYQLPRPWSSYVCFPLKDLVTADSGAPLATDPPTQQLAILALRHAMKPEKGEAFEALYLRIENELLQKEVAFPSSGFSFPVEQAVWLSTIVALLMLVMLHDRLGHVLDDGNLGRGEPWLVLDARDHIARGVAALWCIAMGIGPWLLCVITARMALFHLAVYQSRLTPFLLLMLLIVSLFLMTGFLSISVVAYVLRLKKLRANSDAAALAIAKPGAPFMRNA